MKCQTVPTKQGDSICTCCQRRYPAGAEPGECSRDSSAPAVERKDDSTLRSRCCHRGSQTRRVRCESCAGDVELKVFSCGLHGECTIGMQVEGMACCGRCDDFVTHAGRSRPSPVLNPCACASPGWCAAFGRFQSPHDWQICRGQALTPQACDERRGIWMSEAQRGSHLWCCHRGESRREQAGTPIFDCGLHGFCTLQPMRDGQIEAVCESCADRRTHVPKLLGRQRLDPAQLLPAEHQFNCSLIQYGGKLLLAYRLHWANARIVLAELNDQLNVVKNHTLQLRMGQAQEDPRLFVYRGELHVSYSALYRQGDKAWTDVCYARLEHDASGNWHVSDEFCPHYVGRTTWEKNWGFFEHDGELLAVYSISPHRVLRIDGNRAELIAEVPTRFTAKPGMLHGGAPPAFHRGEYYCFYHRRLGASAEKFYSLDLYTFEAKPPFRPSRQIAMPLLIPDAQDRPAPTVPQAVFPGGAFIDDQHRWTVSFGYYDKWSELAWWDINQIESCLTPISGSPMAAVIARKGTNDLAMWKEVHDWNEYWLPESFDADDVIVDVGAHIGSFTRACLDRGAGIVIACEPYPPSFELLKQNCAYYVHKADLCQVAVGAKRGTLSLRNRDTSGRSLVAISGHFDEGPVVCETNVVPLDEVMPPCPIRLLKLDCEGAEYDIVAAADLSRVEEIVGEAHRVQWRGQQATMADLDQLLTEKGFAAESKPIGESAWLFRATPSEGIAR